MFAAYQRLLLNGNDAPESARFDEPLNLCHSDESKFLVTFVVGMEEAMQFQKRFLP